MKKTRVVQIRLSAEEKDVLVMAASRSELSLSSWVRDRLRTAATRELETAGQPMPFVRAPAGRGRKG